MRHQLPPFGFGATIIAIVAVSRVTLMASARRGSLRLRRWRHAPHHLLEQISHRTFDWWHRVDTRVLVELAALDIDSGNKPHGERYQASPIYSLRKLLRGLDIDHADFSFIDIGSGKGRTLLLAGELPFRRVTGVEFSPSLHACALRNIAAYRRRQAQVVTSVLADATAFVAPPGNLVLYFFNPFTDAVLAPLMRNVATSLRDHPRRLLVIYLYLPDATLLERWPELRLRAQWHRYHVFEWIALAS